MISRPLAVITTVLTMAAGAVSPKPRGAEPRDTIPTLRRSAPAVPSVQGLPCGPAHIAVLRGADILNSMPEYTRAESLLAINVNSYKAELAKESARFDSAAQAFQEKSAVLTATQKASETKRLQDMQAAGQQHETELGQKAAQERQERLEPITSRVQEVIDGLRAELNCAMIFDASAQTGIVSIDKSLDLTQRVIDRLKTTTPAATPPAQKNTPGIKPPAPTTRKP